MDFKNLINQKVTVYGQTEVTKDLYDVREKNNGKVFNSVKDVKIHEIETSSPYVTCKIVDKETKINADFIIGCDGFHGVSRNTVPKEKIKTFERVYPFAWLGILSETPPISEELIYANHKTGFALASMRNENLSRYYIQTSIDEKTTEWSDDRFWNEIKKRLPEESLENLVTGPSIEKSLAPLRSFVVEPMSFGNLFLVGDAAHTIHPLAGQGVNLGLLDAAALAQILAEQYQLQPESWFNNKSLKAFSRWRKTEASEMVAAMESIKQIFTPQQGLAKFIRGAGLSLLNQIKPAKSLMIKQALGLKNNLPEFAQKKRKS